MATAEPLETPMTPPDRSSTGVRPGQPGCAARYRSRSEARIAVELVAIYVMAGIIVTALFAWIGIWA